jgi:hypothetical protein
VDRDENGSSGQVSGDRREQPGEQVRLSGGCKLCWRYVLPECLAAHLSRHLHIEVWDTFVSLIRSYLDEDGEYCGEALYAAPGSELEAALETLAEGCPMDRWGRPDVSGEYIFRQPVVARAAYQAGWLEWRVRC